MSPKLLQPTRQTTSEATSRSASTTLPENASESSLARWLTLAALSLGYGVVQLDITIVNTALTSIGAALEGGVSELQWVVSAYTIAFAALILTAGALGDRVGAKRVFMAGFALFTAASLACALAPTAATLVAARAVQGSAAAILVPNSLSLLNHSYPNAKDRGRAVGIWAAGASVALTAGPFAGGVLIALAGWRSIFLINLPIGLAALWLTWRFAGETTRSPGRELDLGGQIAAIAALGCLAGAMIEAGAAGWTNRWVLAGFAASLLLAAAFLVQERRVRQPMLPLALFQNRMFAVTSLGGLLVNIAFYGLIFVLSLYFQKENGWSAFNTGLAFVPMMAVVLPANLLAAPIAERFGSPAAIAGGALLAATGCLALLGLEQGSSYWSLCLQLMAMGAGLGLLVPPLTSALLGSVEKRRSGVAAGVLNATRQTGSVLGVALFGSLIGGSSGFVAGAKLALIISGILFICTAVIVVAPERRHRRHRTQVPEEPRSSVSRGRG
jgi:MFS transporter, DHA2 family, methylenomycin A resistance protein